MNLFMVQLKLPQLEHFSHFLFEIYEDICIYTGLLMAPEATQHFVISALYALPYYAAS